jgi:hypothetical protein
MRTIQNGSADFTKMRIGAHRDEWGRRFEIVICQKCDRRGRVGHIVNSKTGRKMQMVDHKGRLETFAGVSFFKLEEHCMYRVDEAGKRVEAERAAQA